MYVPIMKNRDEELRVIQTMNGYFCESMIPLIEIIKEKHTTRFKLDDVTGKVVYIKKPGNKNRTAVKLPPTEDDIITLEHIQKCLNGKKAFIDFFRFTDSEYGHRSFKGIELSMKLSRDFDYYKKRILEISSYKNLIPVISIKDGFKISDYVLKKIITDLKKVNSTICIRITDIFLDEYSELFEDYLTINDYIMLDIREQNVDSKFIELEEFSEIETQAKKILLNSPRSRNYKNGDFENLEFTKKINNKVAKLYKDYELDGFGDFGGLKDDLPIADAGSNGTGVALGLIYLKTKNAFLSIKNDDSSMGVRGYEHVRSEILRRSNLLDKDSTCVALQRIKNMNNKFGTWKTWNNITLTRYIQQQAKK